MSRKWTSEDDMALEYMWAQGLTAPEIASALGRSTHAVYERVRSDPTRYPPRHGGKHVGKAKRWVMRDLHLEGWSAPRIAEYLGLSPKTVTRYIYEKGENVCGYKSYRDERLSPPDEPDQTPGEWYCECIHSGACRHQAERLGVVEIDEDLFDWTDELAKTLGCGEDCDWLEVE